MLRMKLLQCAKRRQYTLLKLQKIVFVPVKNRSTKIVQKPCSTAHDKKKIEQKIVHSIWSENHFSDPKLSE